MKDFFDVFPGLHIEGSMKELLEHVKVIKVTLNRGKTHLRVYIVSDRWIHKKLIWKLEQEIHDQCFDGVPLMVTVIEKFTLSVQYTPEVFLKAYRESMELELSRVSDLACHLFHTSEVTFPEPNLMQVVIPDSIIAHDKSVLLEDYLHKVF